MAVRRRSILAVLALLSAAFPATVAAQGTARSQDIDTSIRAAGMGGASAAVWWGEPGVWGNPAVLAEVRGVGWLEGRTRLVPGLPADVWLKSRRFLLGGSGVGVSLMGEPFEGLGRTRLDYGSSVGTDPFGNPTGTFDPYEQIDGWGVGVSPLRLFDAIRGLRRATEPEPPRWVDLTAGMQRKHTKLVLAPSALSGVAEADCMDWGVQARLSPLRLLAPNAPVQLDVSGGFAVLNANDARFLFPMEDEAVLPSRIRRRGLGVHGMITWPGVEGNGPWEMLRAVLPSVLEVGMAIDDEHISAGPVSRGYDVQRFGVELTALSLVTGRVGHVTDRWGGIDGDTYGFGIRLPLGPWASVGYDRASVPQARLSGLPDVTRDGWWALLDPVRIWQDARELR